MESKAVNCLATACLTFHVSWLILLILPYCLATGCLTSRASCLTLLNLPYSIGTDCLTFHVSELTLLTYGRIKRINQLTWKVRQAVAKQ
jgi:hypothetical protein